MRLAYGVIEAEPKRLLSLKLTAVRHLMRARPKNYKHL
jgi:hypothetical protein